LTSLAKVTLVQKADHIHNFYDYAISKRYEKIFKRKDLNIISHRIDKIDEYEITFVKDEEKIVDPYSICIYSTGKVINPFAKEIAEKFGQHSLVDHKLAIVVDPSMKIKGSKNIYAIGDCATIDQSHLFQKWEAFFKEADVNSDGVVELSEFKALADSLGKRYPALVEVKRRMEELYTLADINKDGKLQTSEFRDLMKIIDEMLTRFPSTASTAVQQGDFLGDHFNNGHHLEENTSDIFRYKHIGGYEYIGAEDGLVERGSKGTSIFTGLGAEWMWTNVYYSNLVDLPMRLRVTTNKIFSYLFGQDITKL